MQHWPERRSEFLNTSLATTSSFFWSSPCTLLLPAMPIMPARPACNGTQARRG
jgi:hypothetical protein